MDERQQDHKSMREVEGRRVRQNVQMYKPMMQNNQASCLVWYFDSRVIPGLSHKLRSFWARLYQVMKLTAPALVEIKLVYNPGEERLEV